MKMNHQAIFVLVGALLLTSCQGKEDPTKERVASRTIYAATTNGTTEKSGKMDLLFKANEETPYISLKDGTELLTELRKEGVGKNAFVNYSTEGDKATYTNENNVTCTFDMGKQAITFSDFDAFTNHHKQEETLALVPSKEEQTLIKVENSTYTNSGSFTIDLSKYDTLGIYKHDDMYYLPLNTFSDIFINSFSNASLAYNLKDVFIVPGSASFTVDDDEDEGALTPLGKQFYNSDSVRNSISESWAKYNYQSLLFNFDTFYGLQAVEPKLFTSFDTYLTEKGYKEGVTGISPKTIDANTLYALSYLSDGHTALVSSSPLHAYGDDEQDRKKVNPRIFEDIELKQLMRDIRKKENQYGVNIDSLNGIAYITFDHFTTPNTELNKKVVDGTITKAELLSNSVALFAQAYKDLATNNNIKYIAVDLATNEGGDADALTYILGTLVGKFTSYVRDPITGGKNHTDYLVDINLDGKIDSNDKSFRELGKKIVFINTKFAFSCGNALPVIAKYSYPDDVVTLGAASGGGTCVVREFFTPIATRQAISGLQMLCHPDWTDIEKGVAPDIDYNIKTNEETVKVMVRSKTSKDIKDHFKA
ncbi:MAG: hypothetical protein E7175_00010 [Erysipelotrichaceae bacterium]|nr:hypothetical protein [Erysipelotrichaceae bacterium]